MDPAPTLPFAALLRRLRLAAGLSQEELAERAALSVEAIGALERGVRRAPYRATVDLLADALALTPEERAGLHASVPRRRGGTTAAGPARAAGTGLRAPATSFVGRQREQVAVLRLLESTRLLTLTGTGGVGKTRLATRVAAGLAGDFPDGVFLVELAALADPAHVPATAARALRVPERPERTPTETLAEVLREKAALLVLDNCEHVLAAAGALAESLLRGCPRLRILATSREALGVRGETVWWVPSLSVPEPAPAVEGPPRHTANSVAVAESAELFVARATEAHPAFSMTDANAGAVAAICRRLDGIPLAIELAAARARVLTPEQIAARLDARFHLLTRPLGGVGAGDEGALPRQRTLRAALDWSYDLLSAPERRLLERLSVFAGGCEVEAAEAVCADGDVATDALLDLLTELVEKSLAQVEYRGDTARYRLLETVRAYAGERLDASGEGATVRRRHAIWALDLALRAEAQLHGPAQVAWLDRLDTEHDNLRAALQWAVACEEAEHGLRLATAMRDFWRVRGHLSEGAQWLDGLLARGSAAPLGVRAAALHAAATFCHLRGDQERAQHLGENALESSRSCGDRKLIATTTHYLGVIASDRADSATAARLFEESLSLARALAEPALIRPPLYNLGLLHQRGGHPEQARALFLEALALARGAGDTGGMASILTALGFIDRHTAAHHRARDAYEEALRLRRELGDRAGIANTVRLLADMETAAGDLDAARAHAEEALAVARDIGHAWGVVAPYDVLTFVSRSQGDMTAARAYADAALRAAVALEHPNRIHGALWEWAAVAALDGRETGAVRVFAASEALRRAIGLTLGPDHVDAMDRTMAVVRARIGDAAYAAAWADGAAWSPERAVAEALADADAPSAAVRRRAHPHSARI